MTSPEPVPQRRPHLLVFATNAALLAGAAGTLALLLVSARNTPAILIFLYTGWVLLPYVALAFGRRRMAQRSEQGALVMNIVALVVVGAALAVYVAASIMPHAPRPAALFLLVPLACQVLVVAGYLVAVRRGGPSSSQMPHNSAQP